MSKSTFDLLALQAAAIHRGCDPLSVIVWTTNGFLNQRRKPVEAWDTFEEAFKRMVTENQNNVNGWSCTPHAECVTAAASVFNYKQMLEELVREMTNED